MCSNDSELECKAVGLGVESALLAVLAVVLASKLHKSDAEKLRWMLQMK